MQIVKAIVSPIDSTTPINMSYSTRPIQQRSVANCASIQWRRDLVIQRPSANTSSTAADGSGTA